MEKFTGTYFLMDEQIFDISNFHHDLLEKGQSIYEVIRVIERIPLFAEKHIKRIYNSAERTGMTINLSPDQIMQQINTLIEVNELENGNIKLVMQYSSGEINLGEHFFAYLIPHHYPEEIYYRQGVTAVLIKAERKNPNAKIANIDLRSRIDQEIEKHGAYEGLLVNSEGNITEGSRSNVFFIKDKELFTADLASILPGITRETIIDLCKSLDYTVIEDKIPDDSLHQMDAVFITGTSPNVLPVNRIDDYFFESASNPVLISIMNAYNSLIDNYIKQKK